MASLRIDIGKGIISAILLASFVQSTALSAEPLSDSAPLDRGYRQMYNLQFSDAHRTFEGYAAAHPDDPMAPVSDAAAYLFSEFDRLKILQSEFWIEDQPFLDFHKPPADPAIKKRFETAIAKAQRLVAVALKKNPDDANAALADTLRLGLSADYLALIEKKQMAGLTVVKQSRQEAERLLARHPEQYDAWIAVALENYLLSLKSGPVRWLLRMGGAQTDKTVGIEKMEITAEKGHYLLPYARLLLAVADLRNHLPSHAKAKLQWLAKEFPGNRLYREELAKLN
jgi:hypothetical protein